MKTDVLRLLIAALCLIGAIPNLDASTNNTNISTISVDNFLDPCGIVSASPIAGGLSVTVSGETPYAIYCQNATTGEGIYHCNNGNCGSTEIISGLPAGSYTLQVLLRSWVYCNAQIDVTVTSGGSSNNSSSCGATFTGGANSCLLYTSPSPRDATLSRMPSSA